MRFSLWPELATGSTEATEAILEQGQQVGLVAQEAFPRGVLVAADHEHLDDAIRVTRELVGNAQVPAIFEATFKYGGVLVRTDILERRSGARYRLIEVKSATGPKPYYAYDIGIQKQVLSGTGIKLEGTRLIHLNRDYVFDGKQYDVSRLFVVAKIPHVQTISDTEISARVDNQLRDLGQPAPPDVNPGRECLEPVLCEFYDHCTPDLPSDHISLLPRIRAEKVDDLLGSGIQNLLQKGRPFIMRGFGRAGAGCLWPETRQRTPTCPSAQPADLAVVVFQFFLINVFTNSSNGSIGFSAKISSTFRSSSVRERSNSFQATAKRTKWRY
jgi:hypothetical protein